LKAKLPKPQTTLPCKGDCITGRWQYSNWDVCSVTCGGGIRRRTATCIDRNDKPLSRQYCGRVNQSTRESCNSEDCPQWSLGPWSSCSATCGPGQEVRTVKCKLGNVQKSSSECSSVMPSRVQPCTQSIPCPRWTYTSWTFCSKSCGEGYQVRRATCNGMGLCNINDKEPVHRSCPQLLPCVEITKYEWTFDSWTSCSVTCGGGGTRSRSASCKRIGEGVTVEASFCKNQTKPKTDVVACTSSYPCFNGVWITGQWSICTTSCGDGYKKRAIGCRVNGQYQKDESSCKPEDRPDEKVNCGNHQCPPAVPKFFKIAKTYSWKALNWSSCSATCGPSQRKREVVCIDNKGATADDGKCGSQTKLIDIEICERKPCIKYVWSKGKWQKCSSTCGMGKQKRRVHCLLVDGGTRKKVSTKNCYKHTRMTRPDRERRCRADTYCVKWKTDDWTSCDNYCRQYRAVYCWERHTKRKLANDRCRHLEKPKGKKGCKTCTSGTWHVTGWTSCSATCKTDEQELLQTRRVNCVNSNNKMVHSNACKGKPRPSRSQTCANVHICETPWETTDWGPCSETCGSGKISRMVSCPMLGNCTASKPAEHDNCNLGSCVAKDCTDIQRINKTSQNGNYEIQVHCLKLR